jgi:hypothetical protein
MREIYLTDSKQPSASGAFAFRTSEHSLAAYGTRLTRDGVARNIANVEWAMYISAVTRFGGGLFSVALRGLSNAAGDLELIGSDCQRAAHIETVPGSRLPRGRALQHGEFKTLFDTVAADERSASSEARRGSAGCALRLRPAPGRCRGPRPGRLRSSRSFPARARQKAIRNAWPTCHVQARARRLARGAWHCTWPAVRPVHPRAASVQPGDSRRTTSADRRLSMVRPCLVVSQPTTAEAITVRRPPKRYGAPFDV